MAPGTLQVDSTEIPAGSLQAAFMPLHVPSHSRFHRKGITRALCETPYIGMFASRTPLWTSTRVLGRLWWRSWATRRRGIDRNPSRGLAMRKITDITRLKYATKQGIRVFSTANFRLRDQTTVIKFVRHRSLLPKVSWQEDLALRHLLSSWLRETRTQRNDEKKKQSKIRWEVKWRHREDKK